MNVDIDECSSPAKIHECEDQCINVNGSYECDCDIGEHFNILYSLLTEHGCVRHFDWLSVMVKFCVYSGF